MKNIIQLKSRTVDVGLPQNNFLETRRAQEEVAVMITDEFAPHRAQGARELRTTEKTIRRARTRPKELPNPI